MNQFIKTKRLLLEPLTPDHAKLLYKPFCDNELYEYIFWEPPSSEDSLLELFKKICKGKSPNGKQLWLNWAARPKHSKDYSGFFEATIEDDKAMLAYYTFKPFNKMGFAKEGATGVIDYLKQNYTIKRFILEIDTRNRASVRLAESLGFCWFKTINNACELKGFQSHEFVYHLE
ncbi:MAG: GNAT family N-acetyltransferase [Bdellovibrionales bacterium]|nr:GNAT family N-acetyltransferase [Bdellovibrionales bacterium]